MSWVAIPDTSKPAEVYGPYETKPEAVEACWEVRRQQGFLDTNAVCEHVELRAPETRSEREIRLGRELLDSLTDPGVIWSALRTHKIRGDVACTRAHNCPTAQLLATVTGATWQVSSTYATHDATGQPIALPQALHEWIVTHDKFASFFRGW